MECSWLWFAVSFDGTASSPNTSTFSTWPLQSCSQAPLKATVFSPSCCEVRDKFPFSSSHLNILNTFTLFACLWWWFLLIFLVFYVYMFTECEIFLWFLCICDFEYFFPARFYQIKYKAWILSKALLNFFAWLQD